MLHTKATIEKAHVQEAGIVESVIGSSEVLDRMGDIIEQSGWNLKDFLSNPVILWGHNVNEERPPIGKALKVWVQDKGEKTARLMFKIQFDLQDPFAADVFRKIKEGFLSTVSVGYMPTEWEEMNPDDWFGGVKYLKQDLLELSIVPVPANPQALIQLNSLAKTDKRFTPIEEKDMFAKKESKIDKKVLKDSKAVTIEQIVVPKSTEVTVNLIPLDSFKEDSLRVMKMVSEDNKEKIAIIGIEKDKDVYSTQSFRYPITDWPDVEEVKMEDIKVEKDGVPPIDESKEEIEDGIKDEINTDGTSNDGAVEDDKEEVKDEAKEEVKVEVETDDDKDEVEVEVEEKEEEKEEDKKEASLKDKISKAGRILSSKNETKISKALDLLSEVLTELKEAEAPPSFEDNIESQEDESSKGVIPYKDLGILPESESWDGQGEMSKASIEDLKVICAWYYAKKADNKISYKFPHHKVDGDNKAVWRGVSSAMGALLGAKGAIDIHSKDIKGVYDHLAEHYKEFDKEPPSYKMVVDLVLSSFEEEIQAIALDREDKHMVRLIKKVLDSQKGIKKEIEKEAEETNQTVKALEVLNLALSKIEHGAGVNKKT